MKLFFIGNVVFLPIDNWGTAESGLSIKYIKASINGEIFPASIYTEGEIKNRFPDVKEAKNLHDVCKQWGNGT